MREAPEGGLPLQHQVGGVRPGDRERVLLLAAAVDGWRGLGWLQNLYRIK